MNIISLEINDILSIEKASIQFNETGLVLVEGWNHDDGRANGAGKTAIFNALSFALYDKVPRKITASEILRRDAKSGSVKASLKIGDVTYTVERLRPKGARFYKDGVKQDWTQSEWEDKIRLSYTQFLTAMYCAQGGTGRFIGLSDSDKKDFLLQLLNLDEFSSCKKEADDHVKRFSSENDVLTAQLEATQSKIAAYSESLMDEQELLRSISVLQAEISSHDQKIAALQQIPKPDMAKYSKLEQDISSKQTTFTQAKTRRSMLHEQYRKLNAKIKPFSESSSCYACGSAVDTTNAKKAHEMEVNSIRDKMLILKAQIDECDQLLSKEQSVQEVARKLREKKLAESAEYDSAIDQTRDLQFHRRTKQNKLESITVKLHSNKELLNKINTLTQLSKNIANIVDSNKRNVELYKTLSALYAPTGAQAYILDSLVEMFNEAVRDHIYLMWPSATYTLNSYRENAKGDVMARFSESLTMNGKDVSIGSLSGGELRALSLCADFAIIDILEKNFGMRLNPIVLDEPFNDLDPVGREIVISLLSKLAQSRQIFVIDHDSEAKTLFSKVIKVEKRAGISQVSIDL